MKTIARTCLLGLTLLGITPVASAQSTTGWFPSGNPGIVVRSFWLAIGLPTLGGLNRIGVTTSTGNLYYYYYDPTNTTQVNEANAIYATLMSAQLSGQTVFFLISAPDPYASQYWDFDGIQLGPN